MTTICPFAGWHPVQNHSGPLSTRAGLILHVQEGNGSLAGYFNNPAAQASSTFWVSKGGILEQYVDADLRAWAQAAGNDSYNSVETEGYTGEALTDAQINTLAKLYAWGHHVYGWPLQLAESPGQAGLGWHGMGGGPWGGHFGCPGDLRKSQRARIVQLAGGAAPITPPSPNPTPSSPAWPGRYIKQGMSGADVRTWQQKMHDRGWNMGGGGPHGDGVDGDYGPTSAARCGQFQREKGLGVDEIVGPVTWITTMTAPIT